MNGAGPFSKHKIEERAGAGTQLGLVCVKPRLKTVSPTTKAVVIAPVLGRDFHRTAFPSLKATLEGSEVLKSLQRLPGASLMETAPRATSFPAECGLT